MRFMNCHPKIGRLLKSSASKKHFLRKWKLQQSSLSQFFLIEQQMGPRNRMYFAQRTCQDVGSPMVDLDAVQPASSLIADKPVIVFHLHRCRYGRVWRLGYLRVGGKQLLGETRLKYYTKPDA